MSRNFLTDPRSNVPLESPVGSPPWGTVLQLGGRHRAPWAAASRVTVPGSSLWESKGNFRAPAEAKFSKSIVVVIPDVFLKLRDLRQCPETFGTTRARVPSLSCLVVGGSQGSVLQGRGGEHKVLLAAPSRRTLPGVPCGVPEASELPSRARFSDPNSCCARSVVQIMCL